MCLDLSAGQRGEIRAEHSDLGVAFRRKAKRVAWAVLQKKVVLFTTFGSRLSYL